MCVEMVHVYCPLLKLTERLGLSTQSDPRKQRKIANSFVLRVEALLSGVVLGGQTQSLREFQEWAIGRGCSMGHTEQFYSRYACLAA